MTHRFLLAVIPLFAFMVLVLSLPSKAKAAELSLSPDQQSVKVTENLSTTILLNTNGEEVNLVSIQIDYPVGVLTPTSVDSSGSFVNLWYKNDFSTPGVIILEGGISSGTVNGAQETFAKVNFTGAGEGSADLSFDGTSRVLRASDGVNVLTTANGATYTITSLTPTVAPTFGPSPTPTPVGATVAPSPTPTTGTQPPTLPPATIAGTATPTPSILPNGGTAGQTLITGLVTAILTLTGILLLRKA